MPPTRKTPVKGTFRKGKYVPPPPSKADHEGALHVARHQVALVRDTKGLPPLPDGHNMSTRNADGTDRIPDDEAASPPAQREMLELGAESATLTEAQAREAGANRAAWRAASEANKTPEMLPEAGLPGGAGVLSSAPQASSPPQSADERNDRRPEGAVPISRKDMVRPSASAQILYCPGSVTWRVGYPKRPAGMEALDGIRLHEACATLATTGKGLGRTDDEMQAAALALGVNAEDHFDVVAIWMAFCQRNIVSYGEAGLVPEGAQATRFSSDPSFECHYKDDSIGYAGTCDAIIEFPRTDEFPPRVIVADLKTGRGVPVDARGNMQLRSYAALLAVSRAREGAPFPDDTIFDLWIVQPRSARGRTFTRETLALADLRQFYGELKGALAAVAAATTDEARELLLNPGPPCRYCEAAIGCPAALKAIAKAIEQSDPVRITHAPIEIVLAHLDNFEAARPAFENIRAALLTILGSQNVPGWGVSRRAGRKTWRADKEKELTTLLKSIGKRVQKKAGAFFTAPEPLTPAKLLKASPEAFAEARDAGLMTEAEATFSPVREIADGQRKQAPPARRGESPSGFDTNHGLKE